MVIDHFTILPLPKNAKGVAMLVLARHCDESIQIGDNIFVTVVSVHGNIVRLGFTAPPGVPIARTELLGLGRTPDPRLLPEKTLNVQR